MKYIENNTSIGVGGGEGGSLDHRNPSRKFATGLIEVPNKSYRSTFKLERC